MAVATGYTSTCILMVGGKVACIGGNSFGVLGIGDSNMWGVAAIQLGDNLKFADLGTGSHSFMLLCKAHRKPSISTL